MEILKIATERKKLKTMGNIPLFMDHGMDLNALFMDFHGMDRWEIEHTVHTR